MKRQLLRLRHKLKLHPLPAAIGGAGAGLLLLVLLAVSGSEPPAGQPEKAVALHPVERVESGTSAPDRDPTPPLPPELPDRETAAALLPLPVASGNEPARIALIIDDLGNSLQAGERALTLPGAVTYAILPHTPHSRTLAEKARLSGKEIMLHAPMSNNGRMALGPGGLTLSQSREEFTLTLERALSNVPYARGVNNHTGSELTTEERPMQWLMQLLRERELYFVDSLTSADSIAARVASEQQVPNTKRQIFLDNDRQAASIDRAFRRVLAIAGEQGQAVAIGHPYPETLEYLETTLPRLTALGYRLVPVSELVTP